VLALWLPWWPADRLRRSRARVRAADRVPAPAATADEAPLALVLAQQGTHRVVATNPAAADEGVRPGQVLADARALVPGLAIEPAAPVADARALASLADWCSRYSPWIAVDGDDGIRLDVTGCAHLFGGEAALLDDLLARLDRFAIAGRAAIADTLGAAWALARYGADTATVAPAGQMSPALAELPLAGLRLPGDMVADLARLGLYRIEQVCDMPRAALAARFGPQLALRLDQALGAQDEPVTPTPPSTRFWVRLAFAEPIGHLDDIHRAAGQLVDELCRVLERAARGARRVELALYLTDGRVEHIRLGLARPVRAADHILRLLRDRLPALEAGFGADFMTLVAPVSEPLASEQQSFRRLSGSSASDPRARHPAPAADPLGDPDLGRLVDRLGNRLGLANVARFAPQASHLPERAVRVVAPLAPDQGPPWPDTAARPVYLLPVPEPVEAVAEVPDGPPVLFRWRSVAHRVRRADGPERFAPEWWHDLQADPATLAAGTRDYYRIEDSRGRRFWLYRQGLYDEAAAVPRWFLHGLFG